MEPKIASKEAFTVVGLKTHGVIGGHDVPQLWQALGPRVGEIMHLVQPGAAYGLTLSFDPISMEFDYVAGFEVTRVEDLPEDMGSWDVPVATYAVFGCTLPTMEPVYKHATETWLPESGYQRAPTMEFELYDERFDPNDPDSEMEFWIPVKPR